MSSALADVVVVGGGPSGLAAATELRRLGVGSVVVLEREREAGGVPRHCDHPGFGRRDLHRFLSGPTYARRLIARALAAGVDLRLGSTVTDWADTGSLLVTSPAGRYRVDADAVVLATGARERPRPARLLPGDRPSGVLTTGQLQGLVHLQGRAVPGPAVVMGSQLVSWSAVLTLRDAGVRDVLLVTEHRKPELSPVLAGAARLLPGVRLRTATSALRLIGREQLASVELVHVSSGERSVVPCRTLVLTGDWVPDHELARLGGLELDHAHAGPRVDFSLRTSAEGVFAAGNVLHPVDTADVAALDGRHVAATVRRYLTGDRGAGPTAQLRVEPPLRWVAPGLYRPGEPPPARGRLLLWSDDFRRVASVQARQAGEVLGRHRLLLPTGPGRVIRVPWSVVDGASAELGAVTLSLR